MKKAIVLGSIAALSFAAHAEMKAPKVFGRVAKEFRYIQEDDSYDQRSFSGIQDAASTPTRLGASGNIPVNDIFNVDYVIELGANSTSNSVSMRQALATVNTGIGHFSFGQGYVAGYAISKYDLLGATAASLQGFGIKKISSVEAATGGSTYRSSGEGIGVRQRHRKDLVGYKTPKFMGLQLNVTQDRNDETTPAVGNASVEYTDAVLSYENKFGEIAFNAHLGYLMANEGASNDETQMTGALKVATHGFTLTGGYTTTSFEVTEKDVDKTQMFANLGYTMDKCKFVLSYAASDFDDKAADTEAEATQMSFGYIHTFNKNLSANFTYSNVVAESNDTTPAFEKNNAHLASAGMILVF